MKNAGHRLVFAVGFVFGITFLWLALRNTELQDIHQALQTSNLWLIAPFLVTLFVLYWLRALRWSLLLGPLDESVTTRDVFPAVMIGFASNIVLPPPFSDFVRMFVCSRQLSLKNTSVLTTIVLERVFDLLTIVGLLSFALWLAPKPSAELAVAGYVGGVTGVAILVLAVVFVTWSDFLLALLERVFSLMPSRIARLLSTQATNVASGLMALKNARRTMAVVVATVALWLVMGLGIYISLRAVHITVHPSIAFIVLAFTFVGVTLPTTPGAVGTIQLSFSLALAPAGVSSGEAVAASLFWHAIAYGFVVLIGFYYFLRLGYSWGEIRRSAEVVAAEAASHDVSPSGSAEPGVDHLSDRFGDE
jgi:uncharacterized protein (TIRG00374 family)